MTLELKPLGNSCNLGCIYCYQEPMRNAGNVRTTNKYDLDEMMKKADESGQTHNGYAIFGGEALLLPIKDLEYLFKNSYEKYGRGSIQTNGSLITDKHVELFKKYNIDVGMSVDGPNELNDLRVPVSKKQKVEDLTKASMTAIQKLVMNGVSLGIIITVHKLNGTGDNLDRLLNFLEWLRDIGVVGGNIHMLEVDSPEAASYSLTPEENINAFIKLAEFFDREENKHLVFEPFRELERMMEGDNTLASCIWNSCDNMNTQAVYGIEGNGQLSNCGMVNKEGIEWSKDSSNEYLRDIVLYQTSHEQNGCKGCPFFLMCNGYCNGSTIDGDWRNKTIFCSTLKKMFAYYEKKVEDKGMVPFSKHPYRFIMEENYISSIINEGTRKFIPQLIDEVGQYKRKAITIEVRGEN